MKRHVACFVEKAGFEPRTLGTKAERCDHCATHPHKPTVSVAERNNFLTQCAAAGASRSRETSTPRAVLVLCSELSDSASELLLSKFDFPAIDH
jgi:hypothetical protein